MFRWIFLRIFFFINRLSSLPLLSFSSSFIVGIVLSQNFLSSLIFWIGLGLTLAVISKFVLKRGKIALFFILALAGVVFGALRFNYYQDLYDSSWIKENWDSEVSIEAVVAKEPSVKGLNTQYVLKRLDPGPSNSKFGYILLSISRFPEYSYGDKLTVSGVLEEPEVFDEFSYKEYLKTQEIIGKIDNAYVGKTGTAGNPLFAALYEFKSHIKSEIRKLLPEPHASLLLGILLGVKSGMPKEFSDSLANTGTTHIIAVSGYNVTIILAFLTGFSKRMGRRLTLYISGLFLILFLIIVGPDNAPALRATIMGLLLILSGNLGRRQEMMTSLLFIAGLMIFQNPFIFKSISFQLTFASTIGLVVLSKKIENFITQRLSLIGSDFIPTFCAIVATLPITIGNFSTFSTISLIVNIFVLPVIPLIMLVGFILIFSSLLSRVLSLVPVFLVFLLLDYVIKLINYFGGLEFATITISQARFLPYLVYGLLLVVFIDSSYKKYINRYG